MMLSSRASRLFSASKPPSVDQFITACSQTATSKTYPLASSIQNNIPIYTLPTFSTTSADDRNALQEEWHRVLLDGPGVIVTAGMYRDKRLIDKASDAYRSIIDAEKQENGNKGDHFAAGGKNDRIWNSFSKHALADPASFVSYYSNPWLALVCDAWLGPGYRVTAQVNNVKPGGAPQECHRDYHLGFQTAEAVSRFPRAMHLASQLLTLQGAVAHVDVPLESGPTRVLPYSQTFEEGYMAYRLDEFRRFFEEKWVSLPLEKGDGVFFNPALFHAAGENRSQDIHRMVNLLQISSAFGKPMEKIDALPIVEKCWEEMVRLVKEKEKGVDDVEVAAMVAAIGEGYPFPTNLDKNSPEQGDMTPPSEQNVIARGLRDGLSRDEMMKALRVFVAKSIP